MDLAAVEGALPVIVWANGGCFRVDFAWATLFNRWAAAGFVVLALSESPTGGILGQTVSEDQGKLIDWALAQAAMDGGEYEGKLDVDRVIAAGNSCGGVTALQLAAVDERVAAVFVLSGSSALAASDAEVMAAITAPVGFVTGSPEEDAAHPNANMDYELISDGVPAMLVHRTTGDHITVSTDEAVLKQEAEIALHWMDLAVYGTQEAADMLKSPDVCGICEPGMWVLKSKHLEELER
jgi:dienelactone hydrolase